MKRDYFIVPPDGKVRLKNYDPAFTGRFTCKDDAVEKLRDDIRSLACYQAMLYAQNTQALLIILQAMDAAGKDSTIKHVMTGVNPQGCEVHSFKAPSAEELDHDYLWRTTVRLPRRGYIGIFNRSYYEETLVVRVHPELLGRQELSSDAKRGKECELWRARFNEINHFEEYLTRNGIHILKFFLHVSKEEQRRRFLKRLNEPEKRWKFSASDAKERAHWDDYMRAYEDMVSHTSTAQAPWYVIPADHKWFTRVAVADLIIAKLKSLKLSYPTVSKQQQRELQKAQELLVNEPN